MDAEQTLKEEDTAMCVAGTAHVKGCVCLFHKYFLSIHYMPVTVLGTGDTAGKNKYAHTDASQIVFSC